MYISVVMCRRMAFVCRADVLLYGATGKSNRTRMRGVSDDLRNVQSVYMYNPWKRYSGVL